MRIPIAREGFPFIIILLSLTILVFLGWIAYSSEIWFYIFLLLFVLSIFVTSFFRDPERVIPNGENKIVSPADGRIIDIREVKETNYLQGHVKRISIFMSVFNAHVNRYPVSGTIEYSHYNPGKFIAAFREKASLDNESQSIGINTGCEKILVTQIAGLIARRIVNNSIVGETVTCGDRMGMIRFGSRVDIYLPLDAKLKVNNGDKTQAGKTIVGEL